MQDIYKKIYEMAALEIELPPFDFGAENAFIHKGFRISKTIKGEYSWKDVRFDDYYEEVDPLITEKVLELGFVKALTLVMIHNDHDKIIQINRRTINIDMEINNLVIMATNSYNEKRRNTSKVERSKTLSEESKKKRKVNLIIRLEKSKALLEKRRRILKSEREDLKIEQAFYTGRIKAFEDLNIN